MGLLEHPGVLRFKKQVTRKYNTYKNGTVCACVSACVNLCAIMGTQVPKLHSNYL